MSREEKTRSYRYFLSAFARAGLVNNVVPQFQREYCVGALVAAMCNATRYLSYT